MLLLKAFCSHLIQSGKWKSRLLSFEQTTFVPRRSRCAMSPFTACAELAAVGLNSVQTVLVRLCTSVTHIYFSSQHFLGEWREILTLQIFSQACDELRSFCRKWTVSKRMMSTSLLLHRSMLCKPSVTQLKRRCLVDHISHRGNAFWLCAHLFRVLYSYFYMFLHIPLSAR